MKWMILILACNLMIRPICPIIDYVINYEYISTVLCENKDNPDMECNGKCHLRKELAKEAQENNPTPKKANVVETSLSFCSDINPFIFERILFGEEDQNGTSYSNLYQKGAIFSIFHPPAHS